MMIWSFRWRTARLTHLTSCLGIGVTLFEIASYRRPTSMHCATRTALNAAGLDVVTLSRRLGHGSPAITLRVYAHAFSADRDQAAAKAIEAVMGARA